MGDEARIEDWIRGGEQRRAAGWLVTTHGTDVLGTCLAIVKDRAAAEDLTQEVFTEAIRGLPGFRGEASPRTWLVSIARHRCIDYLRARRREPWGQAGPGGGDDGAGDPDAHPDEAARGPEWLADRSLLLHALDGLAEGDRALVTLRFRNGLEYHELATAFGLREGAVRMRISRALARMRQVIDQEMDVDRGPPDVFGGPAGAGRARVGAAAPPPQATAGPPSLLGRVASAFGGRGRAAPPVPPVPVPPAPASRALRAPRGPAFPGGGLGQALAACLPVEISPALAARLAALVA